MITNNTLVLGLFRKSIITVGKIQTAKIYNRSRIGNRDWVAFGKNGGAYYEDDVCYPFPAVRFKENCNELLALREKEKGDWRKLSLEEKKVLYRASFRATLSETEAPTGEWKSIWGWGIFFIGLSLWPLIMMKMFVYGPLPKSFDEAWRRKMLRKILDNKMGHITGLSSKWNYETDTWK